MPRKASQPKFGDLAELLRHLGGISPRRICADPPPGKATEKDVLRYLHAPNKRLYELVDGVLVEKVMGFLESFVAVDLGFEMNVFLHREDLGFLAGADGALRLMPHLVRIPDVSFIAWTQLPTREVPTAPIPDLAPALAVEVLSKGNTRKEMARKLRDYFFAGVRLVWLVDPAKRIVTVYTAPDEGVVLTEADTLDGGAVLPGFSLPVRRVFAKVPRSHGKGNGKQKTPRRKKRRGA